MSQIQQERLDAAQLFAKYSIQERILANTIGSFSPEYLDAKSCLKRQEVFQKYAKRVKSHTDEHGLPSPEFMAVCFEAIYSDTPMFWYSGDEAIPTTKRFYKQAMWAKICDAITNDKLIVEIGPGKSCMLFYAALFGATVIGIESPADDYYYQPPLIEIDGMAPSAASHGKPKAMASSPR